MKRVQRLVHGFAVGVHLAGVALFLLMWSTTGLGMWAALAGWSLFFGAYSSTWLYRSLRPARIAA